MFFLITPSLQSGINIIACADCKPRWLPGLLGRAPSMASEWSRLFGLTRLAPVAATSAQRDVMMLKAIAQLMQSDCGSSSLFPTSEGVIVDDVKTCETLRPEMHVTQIEGFPMFGNADALPALAAACSAGAELRLDTQAGQALTIACGTPAFQAQTLLYAADIERVIASLEEQLK